LQVECAEAPGGLHPKAQGERTAAVTEEGGHQNDQGKQEVSENNHIRKAKVRKKYLKNHIRITKVR
jgi:hypothetical protein